MFQYSKEGPEKALSLFQEFLKMYLEFANKIAGFAHRVGHCSTNDRGSISIHALSGTSCHHAICGQPSAAPIFLHAIHIFRHSSTNRH